ncbi:MAG: ribonuclease III [Acidobacteria bacterium]|nr:ribonuclease III [Acidobacteriota bacterium]
MMTMKPRDPEGTKNPPPTLSLPDAGPCSGEATAPCENWAELEQTIGYCFTDEGPLVRALTHRSYVRESPAGESESNEQMEFLGDSILGFLVSEVLVRQFPQATEGQLSKLKAQLVSSRHLCPVARQMALGQYLRLGKGEEQSGGRTKRALLVDALEALLAAIYLDGGMEPARVFVQRWVFQAADWQALQAADYKSELQELLQEWHAPPARYVVIQERGPEHQKIFTVQIRVGSQTLAQGEGESKKAAQQEAAQMALARLREQKIAVDR